MTKMALSMTVNGQAVGLSIEPNLLLVEVLRENLGLTGTHVGCDTTQCGACTVHLDGEAVKSCTMLAVQAESRSVTTIEGIDTDGRHPLQTAFSTCHALQCGFCTPGMIMIGIDILRRHPDASPETIRHDLEGNFCRCTGYHNIVKAIHSLAVGTTADV